MEKTVKSFGSGLGSSKTKQTGHDAGAQTGLQLNAALKKHPGTYEVCLVRETGFPEEVASYLRPPGRRRVLEEGVREEETRGIVAETASTNNYQCAGLNNTDLISY